MNKFDFLTKTIVDSFSYTTSTQNRDSYTTVNINGREYVKYGTLQAVTIIGNLYEDCYNNRILICGISKQHPYDTKVDKEMGYEIAMEKAMDDPDIVLYNVPEYMDNFSFRQMVAPYIDSMKLEFIKTRQEIIKNGDDPKKYNR